MAANTLLTISQITREAAVVLGNSLDLSKRVNRSFDGDFGIKSAQIGQSINLRRPQRFAGPRAGNVVDIQAIQETYSPITFGAPIGVDVAATSTELTFSIEDYFEKVGAPAVATLAAGVEAGGHALTNKFYGMVGTPGTALTSGASGTALPTITKALALLNKNNAPRASDRKTLLVDPDFNGTLTSSNLTYFNPGGEISNMYTEGYQGRYNSFDVFMNQQLVSHTNGTYGGTPIIASTVSPSTVWSVSSTISTSGWTSGATTLNAGDIFTIAGVYMVNPITHQAIATLQQFTVVNQVSDTSGSMTITVSPAIVTSGGFQNVSQAPQANAAITIAGASGVTTQNSLAFDRDAMVLCVKALDIPSVGLAKVVYDDQTNIPIRVAQAWDVRTNQEILRFDVMSAWGTLYDQLGVRIATN